MKQTRLAITGLDRLAEEELKDILPPESLELTTKTSLNGELPEPATITAIVTLGSLSITALAAWLAKRRNRKYLKTTIRVFHPDGRVEERVLEQVESTEDALQPAIIAEFGSWLKK